MSRAFETFSRKFRFCRKSGNDEYGWGWGSYFICLIMVYCLQKLICDSHLNWIPWKWILIYVRQENPFLYEEKTYFQWHTVNISITLLTFFTFNIQLTCFSSWILFQWNNLNVRSVLSVSLSITKVKKDPKFSFLFSTIFKAARKTKAVAERCSVKVFSEILQNSQENTCARVSFLKKLQACNFILKKKILAQVFSWEFCKISKNTLFTRHVWTTASEI